MTLLPFLEKDLICEKIFGFGSQVTNGEGFVEKHPARPGNSRSLLNFCGILENILLKALTNKQASKEIK